MRVVISCWNTLESEREVSWRLVPISTKTGFVFQTAMHIGPIPWRAIRDWAALLGFGVQEIAVLAAVIRKLDGDRARDQAAEFTRATKG